MANEEHLRILEQGVEVWNQWRTDNPEIRPDLSKEGLSEANLSGIDLSEADLGEVYLTEAVLAEADFRRADLSGAHFRRAGLYRADFREANLSHADFRDTNLSHADFRDTSLYRVDFHEANLSLVDFREADLSLVDFREADLSLANLSEADLSNAKIWWTMFGNVDLSEVKGLDTVHHNGPSYIDIHTVYKSKGNIPEVFLRGAGTPDSFITYMKSLTGAAFDFYSCFISHSSKDKAFAERLHADLQAKGVRCWYAPEDLQIGEPILSGIDKGIRLHDKLLLVLSEHSVASRWVEHEVESALAEEMRPDRKTKMLFPIRLDNAVMETNVDWADRIRQKRHIGDFTQWKDHDAYQKAFELVLRDLKA